MNYKLVALDLDGTLLNDDHKISKSTSEYIKILRQKGIIFTIITGRMYCSARMIAEQLGIENDFLICYNGALIRKGEDIISHIYLEKDISEELINNIKEDLLIFISDRLYVRAKTPNTEEYTDRSKVFANSFLSMDYHGDKITKLIIIPSKDFLEYEKKMKYKFGKKAYITHSTNRFLEIMNPSVSKANALKRYCEYFHIPLEQTISFGDGMNDIEMLKESGLGIAMENSWEVVKKSADDITLSNNEDGVYHYLKNIFG